jgi:hypothetical protein
LGALCSTGRVPYHEPQLGQVPMQHIAPCQSASRVFNSAGLLYVRFWAPHAHVVWGNMLYTNVTFSQQIFAANFFIVLAQSACALFMESEKWCSIHRITRLHIRWYTILPSFSLDQLQLLHLPARAYTMFSTYNSIVSPSDGNSMFSIHNPSLVTYSHGVSTRYSTSANRTNGDLQAI